MGYVVMDMEWNQTMSSQSAVFNKLPIHLRGEIIQIGAVKLTDDFKAGEEFKIGIKPVYFKRMHYKVEKLTGIDKDRLEQGVGFKEAFKEFRAWCGEGTTFLTWGCDDKSIMEQNIIIHDLDWDWIDRWINLQIIYNIQTDAGRNQTGLSIAMEHFGIEQTRTAHDALGDAYNTALVCSKLDLISGIEHYDEALTSLSVRNNKDQKDEDNTKCAVAHKAFTGFISRKDAFSSDIVSNPECPICGRALTWSRWINQGDKRYMSLCSCNRDGDFLIRVKFRYVEDDTWTVNRIIYKADQEMRNFYNKKAYPEGRHRKRRDKASKAQKLG